MGRAAAYPLRHARSTNAKTATYRYARGKAVEPMPRTSTSRQRQSVLAALLLGIALSPSGAMAAERFQKLSGAQIQSKFAGMETTDGTHWADVYQRNGTLLTCSMGRRPRANGTSRKTNSASTTDRMTAAAIRCGCPEAKSSCGEKVLTCPWRACSRSPQSGTSGITRA